MPIAASRVTVTTDATSLAEGAEALTGVEQREVGVRVPSGGSVVYLGDESVTPSTGFALNGGELFSIGLDSTEELYGVTASGSQVVHVIASTDKRASAR